MEALRDAAINFQHLKGLASSERWRRSPAQKEMPSRPHWMRLLSEMRKLILCKENTLASVYVVVVGAVCVRVKVGCVF